MDAGIHAQDLEGSGGQAGLWEDRHDPIQSKAAFGHSYPAFNDETFTMIEGFECAVMFPIFGRSAQLGAGEPDAVFFAKCEVLSGSVYSIRLNHLRIATVMIPVPLNTLYQRDAFMEVVVALSLHKGVPFTTLSASF